MNYIIKDIKRYTTSASGAPFMTKKGNPYTKINMLFESENKWVSCLDFGGIGGKWKIGDVVEGDIIQKDQYWNFEPRKVSLRERIGELERENSALKEEISTLERTVQTLRNGLTVTEDKQEEELLDMDEIPF